jgi:hypothetical protein
MRAVVVGLVVLAAAMPVGSEPAAAGDQFSIPDYRSNYVVRPWGQRYTYRRTYYDSYHTLLLGPRNHFRFRRDGIVIQRDVQRDNPWTPEVRAHAEPMK